MTGLGILVRSVGVDVCFQWVGGENIVGKVVTEKRLRVENGCRKHGISFRLAATVFQDPLQAAIPDLDHSEREDRWVTLGQTASGARLVVVHTFEEIGPGSAKVRIISARKATNAEIRDYEESPQ
jgi:uncharacterized DUF497 family protein